MHLYLTLVIGRFKVTGTGLFVHRTITSVNGKIKREAWVRLLPPRRPSPPVVVRSKADLKAEGDRLMGVTSPTKKKPTS